MFSTLPASALPRDRDARGMLTSLAAHAAAIASAVWLTMGPAARIVRSDAVTLPVYVATPAERRPQPAAPVARRAAPPPVRPVSALPVALPDASPAVVPAAVPPTLPSPSSFMGTPSTPSGLGPAAPGGSSPTAAASGAGDAFDADAVDRPVAPLPNQPAPRYPESLRQAGVDGKVLARFIVDTLGRVEPASIAMVEASHALFAEAVRDALVRQRFVPAEAGGRRVRQLVLRPFLFRTLR